MKQNRWLIPFCGILMAVAAFSIDILLPLLPQISTSLQAPIVQVQWSISWFVLASGAAQLVWGPLSDQVGRKKTLLAGMIIYLIGTLLIIVWPTIEGLLIGRILQGAGAASPIINSRAIIRDLFSGKELARNMAFVSAIFAIGPMIAPLVGAGISHFASWHWVFAALFGFSFCLAVVITAIRETNPKAALSKAKQGMALPRQALFDFREVLRTRQSRYFLIISIITSTSMILILVALPNVYKQEYGVEGAYFAVLFGVHGLGIVLGQIVNRWLIERFDVHYSMKIGARVLVVSPALILLAALAGIDNPILVSAMMVLFATSFLNIIANSTAMILDVHSGRAGSAACLQGALSSGISGMLTSVLVFFVGGALVNLAGILFFICLTTLVGIELWPAWSRNKK